MNTDDGFEIPIHRSLTEPMMLAGLPRSLALLLWTTLAAIGFGLRQIWVIPVAVLLHLVFAAMAKRDPYFFDVFLHALHAQDRQEP